jgi:polar amino acid transport system ATP-binding protein
MTNNAVITLNGITKSFGSTQVLKAISLDVKPGEVLVLIGASGSGKSTVLRIMSGLEIADGGEVWVNEVPLHDAKRAKEIRGHVGMVFQQFNLFPHKTALGNVTLALIKARKMSVSEANRRGMEALERVGLADRAGHYPSQLSGGQQQRVAIARALAENYVLR